MKSRRSFLKQSAKIASGLALSPSLLKAQENSRFRTEKTNMGESTYLELLYDNDLFLGIGAVVVNGVSLRSSRRPMFVEITSPDGYRFINYKVTDAKIDENLIKLTFSFQAERTEMMEWMLHTVRNRRNLGDWTEEVKPLQNSKLTLTITPLHKTIGTDEWEGFTYQYHYSSKDLPIYRILDRSTWEPGGSIIGSEFWFRNGVTPSIMPFKNKEQYYSTEWYLPGIQNPNIFQFHPFQTQFQGFTMTVTPEGTLMTWATQPAHINSLFQKEREKTELAHFHEHCGDLSYDFQTSPMEVLFLKEPGTNKVRRANIYETCKEMVYDELHLASGIKRERIQTYGVIEEWQKPDMDNYINRILPHFIEAKIKHLFLPNECQNTMNVYGVSNMCCNVDFKIADEVGEENMKQFCEKAAQADIQVEMWGNTAISSLVEMFSYQEEKPTERLHRLPVKGSIMEVVQKAKMPWIRNGANHIEADHYAPRFLVLNMRDPDIYAYWMRCWSNLYHKIGIRGIFLDSSFNMTSNKFHYLQNVDYGRSGGATLDQTDLLGTIRPAKEPEKAILSQYHAHLRMIRDMQAIGYHYTGEDVGVFGIHRSGPDIAMRLEALPLWSDGYAQFDKKKIVKAGYNPEDIYFKGFAYRMIWFIYWDFKQNTLVHMTGEEPITDFSMIKAYNEVEPYLYNREILPNEDGVLYHKDNVHILFAFKDFEYRQPTLSKVKDVLSGEKTKKKIVKARKNRVYLLEKI